MPLKGRPPKELRREDYAPQHAKGVRRRKNAQTMRDLPTLAL